MSQIKEEYKLALVYSTLDISAYSWTPIFLILQQRKELWKIYTKVDLEFEREEIRAAIAASNRAIANEFRLFYNPTDTTSS